MLSLLWWVTCISSPLLWLLLRLSHIQLCDLRLGSFNCPWATHVVCGAVRFGKYTGIRSTDRRVHITVNGEQDRLLHMHCRQQPWTKAVYEAMYEAVEVHG